MPIRFEKVSYEYSPNSPFAYVALKNVDVEFKEKKITAIIGATGSGKSTLVQHLNALLTPTSGKVFVLDRVLYSDQKNVHLKELRKRVGLVFQFPEAQLFEETIEKDVGFGPKNFGLPDAEIRQRVIESLKMVGLDESFLALSPFELSGGQKRRVAIAGILAIQPEILVLDEPTAGLDPQGSEQMMELFVALNRDYHKTVLLVTHNMEQVLEYADEVVVMNKGQVVSQSSAIDFFQDASLLDELDIVAPSVVSFRNQLIDKGFKLRPDSLTLEAIAHDVLKGGHHE